MAKKKSKSKAPAAPQPIDYGALTAAATASGAAQASAMGEAQASAYGSMLSQALAAVDQIAGKLNNEYTAQSRSALESTKADLAQIRQTYSRMGDITTAAASDIGYTDIEQTLRDQATRDLALGRQLSHEEERQAQQSARAAYSVRGLAQGNPAATAEILNRDAYATHREDSRRAFAGATNQTLQANRTQRLSLAGDLYGAQSTMAAGAGELGLRQSSQYIAIDPYQRALNSNLPGQVMQGSVAMAGLAGEAYNQNMDNAMQVASFNENQRGNIYNSYKNNQASLAAGAQQASATGAASKKSQTGTYIAAGGAILGIAAIAI